jgi:hypothetical protein
VKSVILISTIAVVALCAAHVDARSHHRAPKRTAPAAAGVTPVVTPSEKGRDPEDVVLDRKIKSICQEC